MSIGDNIRAIRESKGLSMENVGEVIGTSKQFIFSIEKGLKVPSINQLVLICKALNCTPNDIINFNRKEI